MKILERKKMTQALLAVGFTDSTLRIFSLDKVSMLVQLSITVLPSFPESICDLNNHLLVSVNGDLCQTIIDRQTGTIRDCKHLDFHKN